MMTSACGEPTAPPADDASVTSGCDAAPTDGSRPDVSPAGDGPSPDTNPANDALTADARASDAGPSPDADLDACSPTTCAAEGRFCGALPDGCGGMLDCGPPLQGFVLAGLATALTPFDASAVAIADLTGDGRADLVVVSGDGDPDQFARSVIVFPQYPDGSFGFA